MDPITMALLVRGAVQVGASAYQGYKGSQKQKEAELSAQRIAAQQRAITEADKVSGLQVPQLGAELARQSLGQQYATAIAATQSAGAAGVLGGVPGLAAIGADRALDIAGQLDMLEKQRDQFVASQLQAREQREAFSQRGLLGQQLKGAQMASAEGRIQQQQALQSGVEAVGSAAAGIIENQPLYEKQETIMGPDTIRESEYYQFQPQLVPEGVIMPQIDETKVFTTNQPPTNFSGDIYSGLGINRANLFQ